MDTGGSYWGLCVHMFGTQNKGVITLYFTVDLLTIVIKANTVETDAIPARYSCRR